MLDNPILPVPTAVNQRIRITWVGKDFQEHQAPFQLRAEMTSAHHMLHGLRPMVLQVQELQQHDFQIPLTIFRMKKQNEGPRQHEHVSLSGVHDALY